MYTSHTKIIREAIFGLRNSSDPVTILHKKRFKIVSVVAKKKAVSVVSVSVCVTKILKCLSDSGEMQRR